MQITPPPVDVVLSWSLQSALSAGLAVACIALAMTFGRPAMRVLAATLTLTCMASVIIWLSLTARSLGFEPATGAYLSAFALPLSPLLTFVMQLHLVRLLAGREARTFPPAGLLAGVGLGGLLVGVMVARATAAGPDPSPAASGVFGSVAAVCCYGTLVIMSLLRRRDSSGHKNALAFAAVAFALLAARSTMNIAVAALSIRSGAPPHFGLPVTAVQLFLFVVAGVLLIIAVLDEERASLIHGVEQVRLAEAALAQSQRLESLGRMAGTVAHDFNNLLAVIGISAESARAAELAEREVDLGEILAASKRGQELTRQLLAFARQTPQQVMRFDVNHQLDKLNSLLQRMVGKSAVFTVNLASTPQLVEMDVTQFEQVMMNLAVNARDAMPLGGKVVVTVAPSARVGDANADFVCVTVADTGTGIPADVLPHIFEPFFSTKSVGEGSGLGLATCDGIVRRSGGRIDVTTEAGKGSRFDVLIPRATGA